MDSSEDFPGLGVILSVFFCFLFIVIFRLTAFLGVMETQLQNDTNLTLTVHKNHKRDVQRRLSTNYTTKCRLQMKYCCIHLEKTKCTRVCTKYVWKDYLVIFGHQSSNNQLNHPSLVAFHRHRRAQRFHGVLIGHPTQRLAVDSNQLVVNAQAPILCAHQPGQNIRHACAVGQMV